MAPAKPVNLTTWAVIGIMVAVVIALLVKAERRKQELENVPTPSPSVSVCCGLKTAEQPAPSKS